MTTNPYQAPQTAPTTPVSADTQLESVRSGQRMIIFGILAYFAAIIIQFVIGPFAAVGLLVSLILGLIGIVRLSSGLGYHVGLVVLFVILMIIPLVGLVTLLILNSKATKVLREHGYRVGLLGASK